MKRKKKHQLTAEVNQLPEIFELKRINKIISAFDEMYDFAKPSYFSLAFIDGRSMRKLNRTYRGKDKVTDVLSFVEEDESFPGEDEKKIFLGEILICLSKLKSQAKEYKVSREQELARLLIHGLAHLVGFEHEKVSARKEKEMTDFEIRVMEKLKF